MLAIVPASDSPPPLKSRDRRSHTGRRLLDHERRLFALIGGEAEASADQRKAVSDAAEFALAAEKARASYLEDQLSAADLLRFQDTARAAERALMEIPR